MDENCFRRELIQILRGGSAHVPLESVFEGVLPENWNKRIASGFKTIWEELEHMRITQEDIIEYTFSAEWQSPPWPEGYWPDREMQADEAIWKNTVDAFMNDLHRVTDLVSDTRIDLTLKIPHGGDHTYLREIYLIAAHNSYHIGKIVLMRKLLLNW